MRGASKDLCVYFAFESIIFCSNLTFACRAAKQPLYFAKNLDFEKNNVDIATSIRQK